MPRRPITHRRTSTPNTVSRCADDHVIRAVAVDVAARRRHRAAPGENDTSPNRARRPAGLALATSMDRPWVSSTRAWQDFKARRAASDELEAQRLRDLTPCLVARGECDAPRQARPAAERSARLRRGARPPEHAKPACGRGRARSPRCAPGVRGERPPVHPEQDPNPTAQAVHWARRIKRVWRAPTRPTPRSESTIL